MSWLSGYKGPSTSNSEPPKVSPRTTKRNRLQEERLQRAHQREKLRKQLKSAQEAKEAADLAEAELFALDPEIFVGAETSEEVSESILDDEEQPIIMVDFDQQNEDDSATAMDNLRSVQCPFNKLDIEFWFSQLEDQLTLIGVKKQWTKKIALVRFLPPDIQNEVKSLLKLGQTAAGTDIYYRIKTKLLKMYGPKPEDAYTIAKNLVLTDKPSQLGHKLVEVLCPAEVKLTNCHCDRIIWGLFREKIPIVIRNHLADMPFNATTYEAIFDKADQIWDSNRSSEPTPTRQVAAATVAPASAEQAGQEVAAVQRNGQGKGKNQRNQNRGQNRGRGQSNSQNNQNQSQNKPEKKLINDDGHCKIHAKWKENATFCAAPWGCKMKNVYRAPQ